MSGVRRAVLGAGLASAAHLAPATARACAVCAGQDAAVGWALLRGSLLLSLLPLVAIGGVAWYLRRRARAIQAAEDERRAAGPRPARSARAAWGPTPPG